MNNNLWKRKKLNILDNDKNFTFKWTKYSTEEMITDANLFEDNNSCGHLYLFNNEQKCEQFFNYMVDNKGYMPYGLITLLNDADFVCNYKELEKMINIDEVNPIYVIGTLRMFGFKKYLKLCNDGTKIIKFESYNNWWKRKNIELEKAKKEYNLTYAIKDAFKLFFNLLILYINNNEFVFNPRKNDFINNLAPVKNSGITDLLRM